MDAEPCELCGATGTYDEDGNIFCSNGHFQHRAAAEVDDETGRHGKVVRIKKDKKKEKVRRVFQGRKAYKLFLQAWQYVLWKQCYALVHVHGLPSELWDVIKDLWELRLSKLTHRYEDLTKTDQATTEPSGTDAEFSETDAEKQEPQQQTKKAKQASDSPTLIDVAALNYLGVLILRYPLDLRTLFTWLETESIPFIRAIRHLPKDIKDRLPAEYHEALDTTSLPKPQDLQLAVSRMASMYTSTFGITIAPLNFHLFLPSYIESLALPIQLYKTVKHLNTILKYSFSYPSSPAKRLSSTSFPETQLMILIIIAIKLLYPFKNQTHHPYNIASPSTVRLDWQSWLTAKKSHETLHSSETKPLTPGTELSTTDNDILRMMPEQLDAYMDYYQRTFTTDRSSTTEGVAAKILDLFPLDTLSEPSTTDLAARAEQHSARLRSQKLSRINAVQSSLIPQRVVTAADESTMLSSGEITAAVFRPGASYQIFHDVNDLDTETAARIFHEEAAKVVSTSVEALLRAVRSAEESIERWRRARRRLKKFGKREENEIDEMKEDREVGDDYDNETEGPRRGEKDVEDEEVVLDTDMHD